MTEVYLTDDQLAALSAALTAVGGNYPEQNGNPWSLLEYQFKNQVIRAMIATTAFQVYKDGDLTFGVRAGKFVFGDTIVTYVGATAQALSNNTTNYIYLTAAGALTVNTTGFPVPSATQHVPLAEIVTATGVYSIANGDITDRRPLSLFGVNGPYRGGDQYWVGAGAGLQYGSLYIHEGAVNIDITGAGSDVYVKITGLTTGLMNGVAVNSDAFNVPYIGVYKLDWQMSADSQGSNLTYEVDVFINGVEQDDASSRRKFGAAADFGSMSGTGIFQVSNVAHDIDLRIKQVGGVAADIDIFNMNFNITMIGA